jgi:hypothetical protein
LPVRHNTRYDHRSLPGPFPVRLSRSYSPLALISALGIAAVSCTGSGAKDGSTAPPSTGGLAITISGLPNGASGAASVTGPGGFSRSVSATTTLTSLTVGAYSIAAGQSVFGGVTYAPTPATQTVTVSAGATASAIVAYAPAAGRPISDRADDVSGSQIHVIYVLPSDGVDRQLDLNGTLANEVAVWQAWLATQTGGRRLRIDTFQGAPDITFTRLTRSSATIRSFGAFVRDTLEKDLRAMGFAAANKIYAAYYDGGSATACGGGAWPPQLPGTVAALYLQGTPPGATPCNANPFASSPNVEPGYLEYAMIHEIMHTMGIVSPTAPNHALSGHVSTSPSDLMYAGPLPWTPTTLDVNRQNYYNPAGLPAGIYNLATSPFLLP